MDRLTQKQEKFVQNLIKGMSQREAYKHSYNAKNMTDETIDSKACLVFKVGKVRARYEELQNKLVARTEKKALMTAEERMEWLTSVIHGELVEEKVVQKDGELIKFNEPAKLDTRMRAMDIYNKMSGEYTQKIEGSVEVKRKLEDLL